MKFDSNKKSIGEVFFIDISFKINVNVRFCFRQGNILETQNSSKYHVPQTEYL